MSNFENYQWLNNEPSPKILREGLKLMGTKEVPGSKSNPEILAWAKQLGLEKIYTDDSIPWCGLAIAIVVKKAGYPVVNNPLWALNWNNFGKRVKNPELGDIVTFRRTKGGHVGVYVGEDETHYHIMGGNQSDTFNIMRLEKTRMSQARRPIFKIGQPSNVRRIFLSDVGEVSENEA